jgi:Domain of unknown function (DUF1877)
MSIEFSMFAIAADRYEALRADPVAITNEVILRRALDHLAIISFFKRNASEAEVLAEIRAERSERHEDPKMHRRMAELYARVDALVEAALARGDRERPFTLGTTWKYIDRIMAEDEQPWWSSNHSDQWPTRFFLNAPRFGEDVGYGPAGLHDPAAVAAFAACLDLWTPERFAAEAERRWPPNLPKMKDWPGMTKELEAAFAGAGADDFQDFKSYILAAAAARAGMLVWMS